MTLNNLQTKEMQQTRNIKTQLKSDLTNLPTFTYNLTQKTEKEFVVTLKN